MHDDVKQMASAWSIRTAPSTPGLTMMDVFSQVAYYYEDMEILQGTVMPCGLFQTSLSQVSSSSVFGLWRKPRVSRLINVAIPPLVLKASPNKSYFDFGPSDGDSDYEDHFAIRRIITILVLERVGPSHLPLGKPLREDEREGLSAMLSDIVRHRICHDNIRYPNILSAPARSPEHPRLRSPYTRRKCRWRIIDFGYAYESTRGKRRFAKHIEYGLEDLCEELSERRIASSMNLSRDKKT
ncbi:unnamed protein product [Somion occarium]|uniref:Protein kinase domain-containing protein n=1 Tax=Somion occarium TaxID=3059160 RepID=A0ABP1E183_9APHY